MAGRHIELVRSGGFAGLTRRWATELSEGEAAEIERLFDHVAEQPSEPGRGADRFQYEPRTARRVRCRPRETVRRPARSGHAGRGGIERNVRIRCATPRML